MQKLSLGLCSAAIFSRIEAYEWDMDTMMADTVFGRLGDVFLIVLLAFPFKPYIRRK